MGLPLLAGLTILMVGDSHFTYPGSLITTLQDLLVRQGASVTTFGACGVPARVWANSGSATCGVGERIQLGPIKLDRSPTAPVPSLLSLATTLHPNLIIVGLGDTMANYGDARIPVDRVLEDITGLTSRIRALNLPCIWIGPGWGAEGNNYYKTNDRTREIDQILASHVTPCHYIDSTNFSHPGEWDTTDGLHYTFPSYQKWAFAIDAAILKMMPVTLN